MRASAFRMHHALRNALAAKVRILLDQMQILERHSPALTNCHADSHTIAKSATGNKILRNSSSTQQFPRNPLRRDGLFNLPVVIVRNREPAQSGVQRTPVVAQARLAASRSSTLGVTSSIPTHAQDRLPRRLQKACWRHGRHLHTYLSTTKRRMKKALTALGCALGR